VDRWTPRGSSPRAWPDAELVAVRDAGHQGSDTMRERMLSALDELTQQ